MCVRVCVCVCVRVCERVNVCVCAKRKLFKSIVKLNMTDMIY